MVIKQIQQSKFQQHPMQQIDIQAFVSVADLGSFSSAADQLNITQPAVSKRIANLERSLRVALFDRIGRTIVLTQAGQHLLPQAQHILLAMKDAQTSMENLEAETQGELTLATSHHVGLHRLAPVLREFCAEHPAVALNIRFEDSEAAHDLVRQATVELAVVTLDPAGVDNLQSELVWQDPLVFVAAKGHALSEQHNLTLAKLAEEPSILPGLATYTGRIAVQLFSDAGLNLTPSMSTNYLETIGMLVSTGLGWSLLPRSMLTAELCELSLDTGLAAAPQRQLGVVTHPDRTLSNAASAFVDNLRQHKRE